MRRASSWTIVGMKNDKKEIQSRHHLPLEVRTSHASEMKSLTNVPIVRPLHKKKEICKESLSLLTHLYSFSFATVMMTSWSRRLFTNKKKHIKGPHCCACFACIYYKYMSELLQSEQFHMKV